MSVACVCLGEDSGLTVSDVAALWSCVESLGYWLFGTVLAYRLLSGEMHTSTDNKLNCKNEETCALWACATVVDGS